MHRQVRLLLAALAVTLLLPVSAAGATDNRLYSITPTSGGSETPVTLSLAEYGGFNPSCGTYPPYFSAVFETAYIFPQSVDPGTAEWTPAPEPIGGQTLNTYYGSYPWSSYFSATNLQYQTPPPLSFFEGIGPLAPGVYHVGITCVTTCQRCVLSPGAQYVNYDEYAYDTLITVSASATDPNGYTWAVGAPSPLLPETHFAFALPLAAICVGGLVLSRGRRRMARLTG